MDRAAKLDTQVFFAYPTGSSGEDLERPSFLQDAGEPDWAVLLSHTQTRRVTRGEILVEEGALDRALYVLTSGQLQMISPRGRTSTLEAPSVVGEVSFLDGGPSPARIEALSEGELLRLSYEAFESLAARHPQLAWRMLLDLGRIVAAQVRPRPELEG